MQHLGGTLFTFQLSRYKRVCQKQVRQSQKAKVALMSEAQLVEDEIVQFRSVIEARPRFCMSYDAPVVYLFCEIQSRDSGVWQTLHSKQWNDVRCSRRIVGLSKSLGSPSTKARTTRGEGVQHGVLVPAHRDR